MRRREFIAGLCCGGTLLVFRPLEADAQREQRVRRIVWLSALTGGPFEMTVSAALEKELGALGWTVGGNMRIDYRTSGGDPDRLASEAEQLAKLKPDVIFAFGGAAVRAAQLRTRTIPIVFVGGADPAANNLVSGIARPKETPPVSPTRSSPWAASGLICSRWRHHD